MQNGQNVRRTTIKLSKLGRKKGGGEPPCVCVEVCVVCKWFIDILRSAKLPR